MKLQEYSPQSYSIHMASKHIVGLSRLSRSSTALQWSRGQIHPTFPANSELDRSQQPGDLFLFILADFSGVNNGPNPEEPFIAIEV